MSKVCDKCGSRIRDTKYPWYSYYAPTGEVAEGVLWRYCSDCKSDLKKLYGIAELFFERAEYSYEEGNNVDIYQNFPDYVRTAIKRGELT